MSETESDPSQEPFYARRERFTLTPKSPSILIDNTIGILDNEGNRITFVCDRRIPIIREGAPPRPQTTPAREGIGSLTLGFQIREVFYIGENREYSLTVRRVTPNEKNLELRSKADVSLDRHAKDQDEMIKQLKSIQN